MRSSRVPRLLLAEADDILARTSFFGVSVPISMRAEQHGSRSPATSDQERKDYPIYEGDFFGNLFVDKHFLPALARRKGDQARPARLTHAAIVDWAPLSRTTLSQETTCAHRPALIFGAPCSTDSLVIA